MSISRAAMAASLVVCLIGCSGGATTNRPLEVHPPLSNSDAMAADAATPDGTPRPDVPLEREAGSVDAIPPKPEISLLGLVQVLERDLGYLREAVVLAEFLGSGLRTFEEEVKRDGDCRLLKFTQGFCEPACDGICAADGRCHQLYPRLASVGVLSVAGSNAALDVSPDQANRYFRISGGAIPADLLPDTGEITARANGQDLAGFLLTASATPNLADLSLVKNDEDYEIAIVPGQPLEFRWRTIPGSHRVRLTLNSPNRGHGQPLAAIITCDVADTGSLSVPWALLDSFPKTAGFRNCVGIDCPQSRIGRYTEARVSLGKGEVALTVAHETHFYLDKH